MISVIKDNYKRKKRVWLFSNSYVLVILSGEQLDNEEESCVVVFNSIMINKLHT